MRNDTEKTCKCDRVGFEKRDGAWWQVCAKCDADVKGIPIECPSCGDLVLHAVVAPEKQYVIVPFTYDTKILGRKIRICSDGDTMQIYENGIVKSDKPVMHPLDL